jgi:hypothetical protein
MSPPAVVDAAVVPLERGPGMPRAFHRLWSPLWIAFVGYLWWHQLERQLAVALPADSPEVHAPLAAALAAAGHIAGNAVEALFYASFWRARGIRMSFARLFEWLVTISVLDLMAAGLAHFAEAHPGWVASALEVFVGLGVLQDGETPSGLRASFGSFGLLCIARLVATAAIQKRATGRGLGPPLLLTLMVWLIARLASWWLFDLARGMSTLS